MWSWKIRRRHLSTMLSCSVISDSATLWAITCQAPLSMGFSRQKYWSGLPFSSPGDLPDPGTKPRSPASHVNSLIVWATRVTQVMSSMRVLSWLLFTLYALDCKLLLPIKALYFCICLTICFLLISFPRFFSSIFITFLLYELCYKFFYCSFCDYHNHHMHPWFTEA